MQDTCSTSFQSTGGETAAEMSPSQISVHMDASKPQTGQMKYLASIPAQQEALRLLLPCPKYTAQHKQKEKACVTKTSGFYDRWGNSPHTWDSTELLAGCGSASHPQGLLPLSSPMWLSDKPPLPCHQRVVLTPLLG